MKEITEGVLESEWKQEKPLMETESPTSMEESSDSEPEEEAVEEATEYFAEDSEKILELLESLHEKFDKKISVDAHKNELFNNMHDELVALRNDKEGERIKAICIEIILVIDSMHKNEELYQNAEPSEEMYKKLNKAYTAIRQQLEDILYQQSIEPYETSGDEVNVRRQKIIATVPTEDESLNNRIAARVAAGYEKDDKVIRPERIKVYKYGETV